MALDTDSGPNWSTLNTTYFPMGMNVNSFPNGSLIGGNVCADAAALTGLISAPSGSVGGSFPNAMGVYAAALTANPAIPAVGVYGQGMTNSDNSGAWGMNAAASNTPNQPFQDQTAGNDSIDIYGIETDIAIQPKSGGGQPGGNAYGEFIVSGGDSRPTGEYSGVHLIKAPWSPKWKKGFCSTTGASDVGLYLGAVDTGNTKGSQAIEFHTTDGSGNDSAGVIAVDQFGNFVFRSAQNGSFSFQDKDANPIALSTSHKFRVTRSSAANCGNFAWSKLSWDSESFDVGSNFASGTFTIPVTGYYEFGFCVASSVAASIWIASLFKNGSEHTTGLEQRANHNPNVSGNTTYDHFNEGDTVEIKTFGNTSLAIDTNPTRTFFWGRLDSV